MAEHLKIIIDWDGTLTAEEEQVAALAEKSLDTLANEIIGAPRERLAADYAATRARLLRTPYLYWWEVNGLVASYCDEGAFILNTTTLQVMLRENPEYARAVAAAFPNAQYDPVVDCTNTLFHRHTAELPPIFRPAARDVLLTLIEHPGRTPVVLTNSLGDKVRRHLKTLALGELEDELAVLGDTRQYDMDHQVDLRRPVYYRALVRAASDGSTVLSEIGSRLAVVADTFSLPGALPLLMGVPFFLLRTEYTPDWCAEAVAAHPLGRVLDNLADLPAALDALPRSGYAAPTVSGLSR
jgi:phosphoglycolate phosphatase-like HAD superfamily hydrolase